jgi:hypothetical protein
LRQRSDRAAMWREVLPPLNGDRSTQVLSRARSRLAAADTCKGSRGRSEQQAARRAEARHAPENQEKGLTSGPRLNLNLTLKKVFAAQLDSLQMLLSKDTKT